MRVGEIIMILASTLKRSVRLQINHILNSDISIEEKEDLIIKFVYEILMLEDLNLKK